MNENKIAKAVALSKLIINYLSKRLKVSVLLDFTMILLITEYKFMKYETLKVCRRLKISFPNFHY